MRLILKLNSFVTWLILVTLFSQSVGPRGYARGSAGEDAPDSARHAEPMSEEQILNLKAEAIEQAKEQGMAVASRPLTFNEAEEAKKMNSAVYMTADMVKFYAGVGLYTFIDALGSNDPAKWIQFVDSLGELHTWIGFQTFVWGQRGFQAFAQKIELSSLRRELLRVRDIAREELEIRDGVGASSKISDELAIQSSPRAMAELSKRSFGKRVMSWASRSPGLGMAAGMMASHIYSELFQNPLMKQFWKEKSWKKKKQILIKLWDEGSWIGNQAVSFGGLLGGSFVTDVVTRRAVPPLVFGGTAKAANLIGSRLAVSDEGSLVVRAASRVEQAALSAEKASMLGLRVFIRGGEMVSGINPWVAVGWSIVEVAVLMYTSDLGNKLIDGTVDELYRENKYRAKVEDAEENLSVTVERLKELHQKYPIGKLQSALSDAQRACETATGIPCAPIGPMFEMMNAVGDVKKSFEETRNLIWKNAQRKLGEYQTEIDHIESQFQNQLMWYYFIGTGADRGSEVWTSNVGEWHPEDQKLAEWKEFHEVYKGDLSRVLDPVKRARMSWVAKWDPSTARFDDPEFGAYGSSPIDEFEKQLRNFFCADHPASESIKLPKTGWFGTPFHEERAEVYPFRATLEKGACRMDFVAPQLAEKMGFEPSDFEVTAQSESETYQIVAPLYEAWVHQWDSSQKGRKFHAPKLNPAQRQTWLTNDQIWTLEQGLPLYRKQVIRSKEFQERMADLKSGLAVQFFKLEERRKEAELLIRKQYYATVNEEIVKALGTENDLEDERRYFNLFGHMQKNQATSILASYFMENQFWKAVLAEQKDAPVELLSTYRLAEGSSRVGLELMKRMKAHFSDQAKLADGAPDELADVDSVAYKVSERDGDDPVPSEFLAQLKERLSYYLLFPESQPKAFAQKSLQLLLKK